MTYSNAQVALLAAVESMSDSANAVMITRRADQFLKWLEEN